MYYICKTFMLTFMLPGSYNIGITQIWRALSSCLLISLALWHMTTWHTFWSTQGCWRMGNLEAHKKLIFLVKRKKWEDFLYSVKFFIFLRVKASFKIFHSYLSREKLLFTTYIYIYTRKYQISKQNLHLILCCYIPSNTYACKEIQSLCRAIHCFFSVLFNCSVF